MHSFSWWRMVGRVMECKDGAPLTNEIKIFKHCFTILPGPRSLFRYLVATCPCSHIIAASLLMQNICLGEDGAQKRKGNKTHPPLSTTTHLPHPDNCFQDIKNCQSNPQPVHLPDYIRPPHLLSARSFCLLRSHSAPSFDNERCGF